MNTNETGQANQPWQQSEQPVTEKVRDNLHSWQEKAKDNARRAVQVSDEYVHSNPWPIIGCVAAFSLVVGLLLGRSRD